MQRMHSNNHWGLDADLYARAAQQLREDEIEEEIGQDENDVHNFYSALGQRRSVSAAGSVFHQCQPRASSFEDEDRAPSRQDLADALAQRIICERDQAINQARQHGEDVQRIREQRDSAVGRVAQLECVAAQAMNERDDFEQELHLSQMMLVDAAAKNERLRARVDSLEACLQRLLESAPVTKRPEPEPEPEPASAFGLKHTREAIERAVREAAALPEEEQRKKLKALRLKWHPDKHEFLKEMAEEVTKMINEAIDKMEQERGAPDVAPTSE